MKFYISETERLKIASTPPKECWICNSFSNKLRKDKKGYFLPKYVFEGWDIIEHLEQIIKREVIFQK
jgi:hypothetical protein